MLWVGRLSCEHLIHENTDAPAVYFVRVGLPVGDLRRKIVKSATKSASMASSNGGPSEVCQFKSVSTTDYDILRLNVTV